MEWSHVVAVLQDRGWQSQNDHSEEKLPGPDMQGRQSCGRQCTALPWEAETGSGGEGLRWGKQSSFPPSCWGNLGPP